MAKTCLIIDNEDQKESGSFETLEQEAKKQGIALEVYQFLLGSSARPDLLTNNKIDMQKVIPIFKEEFKGLNFDIIAVDWDFEDGPDGINGIELIKQFQINRIKRSAPKILYSGILKDEVETICERYKKEEFNFDRVWKLIKPMIEIDIVNFVDRENYEKEIVSFLSKNTLNADNLIIKELNKHSDLVFENGYPQFEGQTLGKIAEIIANDYPQGVKFLKEIIELTIAHIVKLN